MRSRLHSFMLGFALFVALPAIAAAGPAVGDADLDTLHDLLDNCTNISNHPGTSPEVSQYDADGDGCGNRCDCDYDDSGLCVIGDFNVLKACFSLAVPASPAEPAATHDPTCAESDQDGSTTVTISDFNLFKAGFSAAPGPSGDPDRNGTSCP